MKKKLLLTTALIALLGGGVYAGSGYAVKPLATQFIRQNGFPTASIGQISLTPTGAMIDHIALDGNDFSTLDGITIGFDWGDFLKTRTVHSLSMKDVSITCEIDEQGHFKVAGWDAKIPSSSASSSALLPIKTILLQGVSFDCETPQGNIRLQGKLALDTPNPAEQTVTYALWGQQHQVSLDAKGTGKLSANGDITLSTTLNDGRMNLPDAELSRASGWVSFTKKAESATPAITGQIVAGKVNLAKNILLQDVAVAIDTTKPEILSFKTSPAGYKDITLTGRWITAPQNHIESTIQSASALTLVGLVAPQKIDTIKPWVESSAPLSLALDIPVDALTADKKTGAFSLSLGSASTRYRLKTEGSVRSSAGITTLSFQTSTFDVAGGKVFVSPFALNTDYQGTPPLPLTISVQSVDMAELGKIADIKGLSANGRLSGSIPLTYSTKGISVGKASLKSDKGGTFAYKPSQFPSSLAGDDERMKTVQTALGDFRFSILDMEMNGDMGGKMKTTLKAEGTSPAFGDRPIKLNLNLDGDLGAVLKQALQMGDIGDTIRSSIKGAKK